MNKIKIGIIGAGYIAGVHAGVLARDERVQITAVHDVVPTAAENSPARTMPRPSARRSKCSKDQTQFMSPLRTLNTSRSRSPPSKPANTSFVKSHSRPTSMTHKEYLRKRPRRARFFRWATIAASHLFMQR